MRDVDEISSFGGRSRGDIDEIQILARRAARRSFDDVRRGGQRRAPELCLQRVTLCRWKRRCSLVNPHQQFVRQLKYMKLAKVSAHARKRANRTPALQSNGLKARRP